MLSYTGVSLDREVRVSRLMPMCKHPDYTLKSNLTDMDNHLLFHEFQYPHIFPFVVAQPVNTMTEARHLG